MAPQISVLVPVWNTPVAWLDECIGSIMAQAGVDFELILVDDGSTATETVRRLARWLTKWSSKDAPLRIIRRNHAGTGVALQRALDVARGELLALIGSDDVMVPGRLLVQLRYMQAMPDVDLLAGQVDYIGPDGTWLRQSHSLYDADRSLDGQGLCIQEPTIMCRRQAVLDAGGFPAAHVAQIWQLLRVMEDRGARFATTLDVVTRYRVHPAAASFNRSWLRRHLYDVWFAKRPVGAA